MHGQQNVKITDVLFARRTAARHRLCGVYKFEDLLQVK